MHALACCAVVAGSGASPRLGTAFPWDRLSDAPCSAADKVDLFGVTGGANSTDTADASAAANSTDAADAVDAEYAAEAVAADDADTSDAVDSADAADAALSHSPTLRELLWLVPREASSSLKFKRRRNTEMQVERCFDGFIVVFVAGRGRIVDFSSAGMCAQCGRL